MEFKYRLARNEEHLQRLFPHLSIEEIRKRYGPLPKDKQGPNLSQKAAVRLRQERDTDELRRMKPAWKQALEDKLTEEYYVRYPDARKKAIAKAELEKYELSEPAEPKDEPREIEFE